MSFSSGENMVPYIPPPPMIEGQRWKASIDAAPNCPRCDSSNTKFCYYNNYSLTQPRYFCKGCRRYWTKGGSLRNVPVGGGCRKNRRGKLLRSLTVSDQNSSRMPSRQIATSSVRPDLVLDDPVGNGGSRGSVSSSEASGSDVSGIDLAVLYAKFSSQRPQFDSGGGQSLPAAELPIRNDEHRINNFAGKMTGDGNMASLSTAETQLGINGFAAATDVDFGMIPSSCGAQLLLDDAVSSDIFWSSCPSSSLVSTSMWHTPLQNSEFVPILDDPATFINPNLLNNSSSNWNMFDSSSFEARSY